MTTDTFPSPPTPPLNNILTGTATANTLIGGAGDDLLDGGAGVDTLVGGAGNDTYIVDLTDTGTLQDTITEAASGGTDTLQLRGSDNLTTANTLTLAANFENLDASATGSTKLNITGNALNNVITGNAADNILDGGIGADTLIGGAGNDTYVVDNALDVVNEESNTDSGDLIQSSISIDLSLAKYAGIENLTLTRTAALNGTGNAGANILTGNAGANTLNGNGGTDTLIGGDGNDTYMVDSTDDTVTETNALATGGIDLVRSSVNWMLSANVENLTLTGSALNGTGNASCNVITGNSGDNTLDGGAGVDTLIGGTGNDTYIVDLKTTGTGAAAVASLQDTITEVAGITGGTDTLQLRGSANLTTASTLTLATSLENLDASATGTTLLNLTGNASANTLTGNDANNILDGGTNTDTYAGGLGNDTYVLDQEAELANVTENQDAGNDLLRIAYVNTSTSVAMVVDLNLPNLANVENVAVAGTGLFNVTGNALDNILIGNAVANTLAGGAGNDTLNGGAGADTLIGGAGNDTYVVDNALDVVNEEANTDSGDLIQSSIAIDLSLAKYAGIENITLTGTAALNGTGNAGANILTGNAGANTLNGNGGTDTLIGGDGNDTYMVDSIDDTVTEANALVAGGTDLVQSSVDWTLGANVERLTLTGTDAINGTGNGLNNVITGNAGNNTLDGGAGVDTLIGGTGNDTYVIDLTATGTLQDTITEVVGATGGSDTLQLRGSATLSTASTLTLATDLENIDASGTGSTKLNITGNALNNVITGNAANNTLNGGVGNDTLTGGAGNDTLIGGLGNDTAVFSGNPGDYVLHRTSATSISCVGPDGTDTLIGIEYLQFGNAPVQTFNEARFSNLAAVSGGTYATMADFAGIAYINDGAARTTAAGSWHLLTAADLGNPSFANGTFVDGQYTNANAAAVAASAILDGKSTLVISFRGSDDAADWQEDFQNINGHYSKFAEFVAAIKAAAPDYDQVLITGHSLGGAMAQMFMTSTPDSGSAHYLGATFGSPGTLSPAAAGSDRLVNFRLHDDPIPVLGENRAAIGASLRASSTQVQQGIAAQIASGIGFSGLTGDMIYATIPSLTANYTVAGRKVVLSATDQATALPTANSLLATMDVTQHDLANYQTALNSMLASGVPIGLASGTEYVLSAASGSTLSATHSGWNYIVGAGGNEQLTGTAAADQLFGNDGDDTLNGGAGNDTLNGGVGADNLVGGPGNDTYLIDNTGDAITENVGEGTDSAQSSATYTLSANVENLTLTGSGDINGTGNSSANTIQGNDGANTLDGQGGADILRGGKGNDTYLVDLKTVGTGVTATVALEDTITENLNEGTDTLVLRGTAVLVNATTLTLAANFENLDASGTGSTKLKLTGNALSNVITGNDADNVLNGGNGSDTLIGGAGADTFVLNRVASMVAAISDFNTAQNDRIGLTSNAYGSLFNAGALRADIFATGTQATTAQQRLLYDSVSGALRYDSDGSGVLASVQIATLTNNSALTANAFMLVA